MTNEEQEIAVAMGNIIRILSPLSNTQKEQALVAVRAFFNLAPLTTGESTPRPRGTESK